MWDAFQIKCDGESEECSKIEVSNFEDSFVKREKNWILQYRRRKVIFFVEADT